jgi:hypothetical protein
MNERDTDGLLGELFKRNAPYVDELALRERIGRNLSGRRRRSRLVRVARATAVAFASVMLLGGAAFGAYRLVDLLRTTPALIIGDSLPAEGSDRAPVLVGLVPIAGTATLEHVKSEGIIGSTVNPDYSTRITGRVCVFSLQMSPVAVSGTLEITSDLNVRVDGSVDIKGSYVLRNDQDTWACDSWVGYLGADGTEFGFGVAVGTGRYEGLTLCLQWRSVHEPGSMSAVVGSAVVTGWVQ